MDGGGLQKRHVLCSGPVRMSGESPVGNSSGNSPLVESLWLSLAAGLTTWNRLSFGDSRQSSVMLQTGFLVQ